MFAIIVYIIVINLFSFEYCQFHNSSLSRPVYTTKRNLYAAAVYRALWGLFYLGVFRAVFSSIICIFKDHRVRTIVNKNSVSVH
jgi:hypothetical protein